MRGSFSSMVCERACARHESTSVSIVNWRGNAGNWPRRFETVSTICPSTRPTDRPPTDRKGCRNERRGSVDDAPVLALVSSRLSRFLPFPSLFLDSWLSSSLNRLDRAHQPFHGSIETSHDRESPSSPPCRPSKLK